MAGDLEAAMAALSIASDAVTDVEANGASVAFSEPQRASAGATADGNAEADRASDCTWKLIAATNYDWETQSISDALAAGCRSDLRLCHGGHRVPLADLDAALEDLFERQGVSKTKFKKFVRSQGICLRNMQAYGGWWDLQLKLLCEPKLKIRLSEAKKYKFVKMCLIMLYC